MKSSIDVVRAALAADIPVLLWGAPGTGKTAVIRLLAEKEGAHVETLIGSTLDPTAVAGLPVIADGGTRVNIAPPAWAERLRDALKRKQAAWLFLDELSCSPASVQAAFLRIVHERQVDGIDLRGIRVLAASNPTDSAADGGVLAAATANRWAHIDWTPDLDRWTTGELTNWGKEGANPERGRHAAAVTGFLRRKQDMFLNVPSGDKASRGWPSPRAWSAVIAMLTVTDDLAVVGPCVGDSAANEFSTYRAALDLPDPEDVLSGKAKIPERGDQAYATLYSVTAAVLGEHKERRKRVEKLWTILQTLRMDIAATAAKALLTGAPGITPPDAVEFANKVLSIADTVR